MYVDKEIINWVELNPPERSRTYYFGNGDEIKFENVKRIEIRDSGKHRIETVAGAKAFVTTGWLCLMIDTDEWTC